MGPLTFERLSGTTEQLHARDPFVDGPPSAPMVWWCDFSRPSVALGSRQQTKLLDLEACRLAGVDIARRRSGGGAVILRPGEMLWIDLIVPSGWGDMPDDVRGSMMWVGERWKTALTSLVGGLQGGEIVVHDGGMVATDWSDLMCFAGLGPGEVLLAGNKLVGLSQRRTRHGSRFQGLVHFCRPRIDDVLLFAEPRPTGAPSPIAVLPGAVTGAELCHRLVSLI
jgi:lipoate---protein ligase